MASKRLDIAEVNVVVAGCGSIGKRHIANLKTLGVKKICAFDPEKSRLKVVKDTFNIPTFESIEAALATNPNVAFITSPTRHHLSAAVQCGKQGCNLFIEKPLAETLDGVDELIKIVEQNALITLVGCNMRFHPGLERVKALLAQGVIGKVSGARVEFGSYLPDWRPTDDYRRSYSAQRALGGGIILDAIHEIDYIHWLLGEVTSVACFADKLSALEIDTEDTAAILFKFSSGAIGEVHLDYLQREYSRTLQLIGSEGTIRWDFTENFVSCYTAAQMKREIFRPSANWEFNDVYVAEIKHYLNCLNGTETSCNDVYQAKRVLELALAAKTAANKKIVL